MLANSPGELSECSATEITGVAMSQNRVSPGDRCNATTGGRFCVGVMRGTFRRLNTWQMPSRHDRVPGPARDAEAT